MSSVLQHTGIQNVNLNQMRAYITSSNQRVGSSCPSLWFQSTLPRYSADPWSVIVSVGMSVRAGSFTRRWVIHSGCDEIENRNNKFHMRNCNHWDKFSSRFTEENSLVRQSTKYPNTMSIPDTTHSLTISPSRNHDVNANKALDRGLRG